MVGAEETGVASSRRVLLVSVPRTASNLLLKLLNIHNQPNLLTSTRGGYFFYPAYTGAAQDGTLGKPASEWSREEKEKFQSALQACIDNLEEYSSQAKNENKTMFAKEHAFWFYNPGFLQRWMTGVDDPEFIDSFRAGIHVPEKYGPGTFSASNETILPDAYLHTWQMAFLIRHPALSWPSMYRAMQKISGEYDMDEDGIKGTSLSNMTYRWTRRLYDWCATQPDVPTPPPVVDAHDLIHSPQIVLKFCDRLGLDRDAVQYEWNAQKTADVPKAPGEGTEGDERGRHSRINAFMLSTLNESSGVVKDKAPVEIDIEAESVKWNEEFGAEIAGFLHKAVLDSMPDYEYLKARRITA
ncbi:hypothetical protein N7492_000169 [Penicillium capsulatum]|uniref:Uncharacterized protein n=1 Tax=Penicillium capsulatum TaxID=69766 RepID=A0A9W9IQR4_9EURO|nr:hypothetical protein N7492_000169 [Penicillium capsulatum]KAJ6130766.1 hypothetical protein N7512_003546 [Penicillium capsulatum]